MRLNYTAIGKGSPLVILHGLYGSGDNWFTIAKKLSPHFHVYLPDQRNHGNSPHHADFNYEALTSDLEEFFRSEKIEKACLMGHSMGGKVAMNFALRFPGKVTKLVIIDIALRSYENSQQTLIHRNIVESLAALDILNVTGRSDVDVQLAEKIPQIALRQFLLKNLKRKENDGFYWGLNLLALQDNMTELLRKIEYTNSSFQGSVLVVSGKNSGYINSADRLAFKEAFPASDFKELDAGHWIHVEQPERLIELLLAFLPER